jgi:hypothetical protein
MDRKKIFNTELAKLETVLAPSPEESGEQHITTDIRHSEYTTQTKCTLTFYRHVNTLLSIFEQKLWAG